MAEVASAFVSLMPSAKGFGRSTERQIAPQMNGVAKRTGSRFGKVFASATMSPLRAIGAAAIALFAVAKVKQFFQVAVAEAREAQKVSAITAQVIKSTGGAANISAEQVGRLAASISGLTGIDDEAIQSGANLLLTFKNLRNEAGAGNDIFNQTTRIMTDMSVALGTDAKGSAIQLGKALNDPIKGITALTRVGVSFTDQQKDQIAKLVESGNILGAQKIILKELKSEFGGTAAAAATAGDRFKVAFANLQESVGTALLPLLDKLLLKGVQVIGFLQTDVPKAFVKATAAVTPLATIIRAFVEDHLPAFKTALAGLGGSVLSSLIALMGTGLVAALGVVVGALTSPIALIGALAGAFLYAYRTSDEFRLKVNELAAWTQANLVPALVAVGATIRADVLPAIVSFADWLFTKAYPAAINFWQGVGQKLQPALVALGQTIRADITPALRTLVGELRQHQPAIQQATQLVIRFEAAYGKLSSSMLGKVLPPLIKVTGFLIGSHLSAVASVIDMVFDWIGALGKVGGALGDTLKDVARFTAGVKDKFGNAISFVKTVPGQIKAALGDLSNILYAAGRAVIGGLIKGITDRTVDVIGAVSPIAGLIAKNKGPIEKDAVLLVPHGRAIIGGLIDGLLGAKPDLLDSLKGLTVDMEKKVLEGLTSMRDSTKSILDGLKSDFASLKSSIASTFTGDLFSSTNADGFLTRLTESRLNLGALSRAFKKLEGWGLKPQFLAQLFQSGNGGLILDLASGNRGRALDAGAEFAAINSLSNQLGGQVARDSLGPKIDRTNELLRDVKQALDRLPKNFGREINGASAAGNRGRVVP